MRTSRTLHPRGATILEALIAIGLLTIVLPGLFLMANTSGKVQRASQQMENAVSVGQSVLDSLSLVPASLLPTSGSVEREAAYAGKTYRTIWWYVPVTPMNGVIHAEVTWNLAGQQHTIRLVGGAR